jgi:hypothetical protein
MSDPIDKAVGNGLGKVIPKAYDEIMSPSARALGDTLESAVKATLRPVDGLVWSVDRAFDWVAKRVSALLAARGVDPSNIHRPTVEVASRALLALQTAGPSDDPTLRNLFAALLTSAMTGKETSRFHPSFLNVLSLLTSQEARLVAMAASTPGVVVSSRAYLSWGQLFKANVSPTNTSNNEGAERDKAWPPPKVPLSTIHKEWDFMPPSLGLDTIELGFALRNLERNGIIEQEHISGVDYAPEKLHDAAFIEAYREYLTLRDQYRSVAQKYRDENPGVPLEIDEHFETDTFTMTIWGADFARACAAPDFYDAREKKYRLPDWAA